jgi:hypothetical protein
LGELSATPSFLEKIVRECLPLYPTITRVAIQDGRSTSFWLDKWLPGSPLAERFPAIFAHCTRRHATVATVATRGLDLQPRLSAAARAELSLIRQIVDDIRLTTVPDDRAIDSTSAPRFSSREAYRMLSPQRPRDESACTAWGLRLPSKLKIFSYLLDIDRLSTRANLFYKHCAPSTICASCPVAETRRHLFFDCSLAATVWARLEAPILDGLFSIWDIRSPLRISVSVWHTGVATTLWAIWKSRNDLVFNGRPSTPSSTLLRACDDLVLWRWRLPPADWADLDTLRS